MTTTLSTTCPAWCQRTDHDADSVGPNDPPMHYGPEFGRHISIQALGASVAASLEDHNDEGMTAADLRQLAADALAAATWVEAQR